MFFKEFKVVAVSENTNSFGLRGFIAVARDGEAFQAAANSINIPQKDAILRMPFLKDIDGNPTKKINYAVGGYEIPEKLDNWPANAVKKIWGN